ncbi:MAG: winged helix-turn-helix domain-containing protein, partial [Candidatus Aenigmatarchaeota archaeon]
MEAILKVKEKIYFPKEVHLDEEKEKIIKILLNKEMSLKEISKELKISPQLAYYKLKKLEKEGYVVKKGKKYVAFNSYFAILGEENSKAISINSKNFWK